MYAVSNKEHASPVLQNRWALKMNTVSYSDERDWRGYHSGNALDLFLIVVFVVFVGIEAMLRIFLGLSKRIQAWYLKIYHDFHHDTFSL